MTQGEKPRGMSWERWAFLQIWPHHIGEPLDPKAWPKREWVEKYTRFLEVQIETGVILPEGFTIEDFCAREGWSRATFERNRRGGTGPQTITRPGKAKSQIIPIEEWVLFQCVKQDAMKELKRPGSPAAVAAYVDSWRKTFKEHQRAGEGISNSFIEQVIGIMRFDAETKFKHHDACTDQISKLAREEKARIDRMKGEIADGEDDGEADSESQAAETQLGGNRPKGAGSRKDSQSPGRGDSGKRLPRKAGRGARSPRSRGRSKPTTPKKANSRGETTNATNIGEYNRGLG